MAGKTLPEMAAAAGTRCRDRNEKPEPAGMKTCPWPCLPPRLHSETGTPTRESVAAAAEAAGVSGTVADVETAAVEAAAVEAAAVEAAAVAAVVADTRGSGRCWSAAEA